MKFVKSFPSILLIVMCSCAHVTPVLNESKTVEFDGNKQTAGIVDFLDDGSMEITTHALVKYNALIEVYGKVLKISTDFGVTKLDNGNFSMTREAAENWFKMKLMSERDETENAK